MSAATAEEVKRVRELECEQQGHQWSVITEAGSRSPKLILCKRCGDSWKVK